MAVNLTAIFLSHNVKSKLSELDTALTTTCCETNQAQAQSQHAVGFWLRNSCSESQVAAVAGLSSWYGSQTSNTGNYQGVGTSSQVSSAECPGISSGGTASEVVNQAGFNAGNGIQGNAGDINTSEYQRTQSQVSGAGSTSDVCQVSQCEGVSISERTTCTEVVTELNLASSNWQSCSSSESASCREHGDAECQSDSLGLESSSDHEIAPNKVELQS